MDGMSGVDGHRLGSSTGICVGLGTKAILRRHPAVNVPIERMVSLGMADRCVGMESCWAVDAF